MVFRGSNPAVGALVDFWLADANDEGTLRVHNDSGAEVAELPLEALRSGLNRVVWNLRHSTHGCIHVGEEDPHCTTATAEPNGPLVVPGSYSITVEVGGHSSSQGVLVLEDPRTEATEDVRTAWTAELLDIAHLSREVDAWNDRAQRELRALDDDADSHEWSADMARQFGELRSRVRRLYGSAQGVVAPLTTDQQSQLRYYREMAAVLMRELGAAR